jgi:DNA repair protein SbcD/Mre11
MKILHTSDWHLGQKFIGQSRDAEHEAALDWLLDTVQSEDVEVLIVAGDIFDVNNPPVSAENLYFRFLARLLRTRCRHIVITGGNHDSPIRLEAPQQLLKSLGIHIVGAATGNPADEIIELYDAAGRLEAIVAAVPFLRDRDFRVSLSGESTEERILRIQEGIAQHYAQVAALVEERLAGLGGERPPVIATGHLYARGASAAPEQNNIYIGNLDNISAEAFPPIFDYVALGHIHRAQKVGKKDHIRYSGSLIPLSFSETNDKKTVYLLEMAPGKGLIQVAEKNVPGFRRLISLQGTLATVEEKLRKAHDADAWLPAWVEVLIEGDPGLAALDRHLREFSKDWRLDILKIRRERQAASLSDQMDVLQLESLSPEDVFRQRCISQGLDETEIQNMILIFRELNEWMLENED